MSYSRSFIEQLTAPGTVERARGVLEQGAQLPGMDTLAICAAV
jgi:hypothetical protein